MSVTGIQSSSGTLPVVAQTYEPQSVREGSTAVKHAWQEGLAFEEMLLEQVAGSFTATSGLGGAEGASEATSESGAEAGAEATGSSAGGSAEGSMLSSMAPRILAEGIQRAGGIGLAGRMALEAQAHEAPSSHAGTGGAVAPGSRP